MTPHEFDVVLTFIQQHPDTAARQLELQPQSEAADFIRALPLAQGRQLLANMLPSYIARIGVYWSLELMASLIAELNANRAAAILRHLPKLKRDELLDALPEKIAALCRLLLSYSHDSVGAWMNAEVALLPPKCQVSEALQRFSLEDSSLLGDAILLVDDNGVMIGQVYLRDLVRAKGETPVFHLRQDAPPVLLSRTSLKAAALDQGWHSHDTLPVLNRNRQLVGLLRHVDLRNNLEQFVDSASAPPQHDLLNEVGEAYGGALVALLGLFGKSSV